MKNIIKIIVSDIKRLSVNVVAMVVIIGLTVIPCLYAWFNILSNWDPYGESATSNLQVAVASSDQGIVVGNIELNIGDIIISNLKENKTIGWIFTDTENEAIDGVYSGDYYAAIVIDEEFSSNMISFLSGEIENPKIVYYENEKKNAIAPKITSKVKTTIEREVDHAFVSTIAESLLKGGEYFATLDEEGNITGQGINKLERLDSDINGVIVLLDSYIALMNTTEEISKAGESISDSANSITELAKDMANSAETGADEARGKIQKVKDKTDDKMSNLNSDMDYLETVLVTVENELKNLAANHEKKIEDIHFKDYATLLIDTWNRAYPVLTSFMDSEENLSNFSDLNDKINAVNNDLESLQNSINEKKADIESAKEKTQSDIRATVEAIDNVRRQYPDVLSPLAQDAINTTAKSVEEIEKLLNYSATSIDLVADSLDNYSVIMDQSKESLVKARDEAVEMERQLSSLIAEIKSISGNEAYQKIMELLKSDPELLSEFISSPVEISDEYVYPVENNGSMTAPFYIVLSIWVGALIMSTILKTTIKNKEGLNNLKNWQCFFGRYFVTFMIGQTQTIITVLGAFLFVGIQCEHPFYFWLACAWTSLIYSLLLYSFTYSFGNVGEALSVILMVIQVAGAGGTFPIEVLPKVFQILYKFMPFNYSMNALRECIAGFYGSTYKNCMLILVIYAVVAMFVGIVLYHPFKIINEKIENSKEKSGILI